MSYGQSDAPAESAPIPGVDPGEWNSSARGGAIAGVLDAEEITHVLRTSSSPATSSTEVQQAARGAGHPHRRDGRRCSRRRHAAGRASPSPRRRPAERRRWRLMARRRRRRSERIERERCRHRQHRRHRAHVPQGDRSGRPARRADDERRLAQAIEDGNAGRGSQLDNAADRRRSNIGA